MQMIPALAVLAVVTGLSIALILKLTGPEIITAFTGRTSAIAIAAGLFGLVLVTHLFAPQDWTADVLKVLIGALLGTGAAKAADTKDVTTSISDSSGVDATGASIGDHAKVAGRDINETIEQLQSDVTNIKDTVVNQYPTLARAIESVAGTGNEHEEYLINTLFERGTDRLAEAFATVVGRWERDGWRLRQMTSDYQGMDGVILLFSRASERVASGDVKAYHGSRMEPVNRTG